MVLQKISRHINIRLVNVNGNASPFTSGKDLSDSRIYPNVRSRMVEFKTTHEKKIF